MGANPRLITADDLLRMPRGERRYELVRGVLVSKMLSENLEGTTIARVSAVICKYADDYDYGCPSAGEPGFWLERDPDTVLAPQAAWVKPGRIPAGTEDYPELAPDLAVEVKFPEQLQSGDGRQGYNVAQLRLAGSVGGRPASHNRHGFPSRRFSAHSDRTRRPGRGDLLPGFTTPVWRLFRRNP